jgi:hypothetical protein
MPLPDGDKCVSACGAAGIRTKIDDSRFDSNLLFVMLGIAACAARPNLRTQ